MYLYYDKNLNLRTKIDHGEKIRQGSDFEIVLCLDADFEFESMFSGITATIVYNGNKIGSNIPSEYEGIEAFQKLYSNENTVDLIDGVSYWMYHFKFGRDPYTLNSGKISFVPTLNYYASENDEKIDVSYKELTFGSADLFVEKTIGAAKQNINLTNNFYKEIEESIKYLNAKKANKNDLPDEEVIIVDGKPVLVSKEFVDLINNEQLNENLDKINQLFEGISNKPTEIETEIIGESVVSYRSLKNTKWTFNDDIDFNDFMDKIKLNFVSDNIGYSSINIRKNDNDLYAILYDETEVYTRQIGVSSEWHNPLNKTVLITDGDDLENIEVIAWFENNAICIETPNDSIKYSLVLTKNVLTLIGTDGTRSTVVLDFVNTQDFNEMSQDVEKNSSDVSNLTLRVKALEEKNDEETDNVENVVARYVINTVNDLVFDRGIVETVHDGYLLSSLKTVNNDVIKAEELKIGDVIYNKQLNQPDLWISDIVETVSSENDLSQTRWQWEKSLKQFTESFEFNFNFVSNGVSYEKIIFYPETGLMYLRNNDLEQITVYTILDGVGSWVKEEYETVFITGGIDATNVNKINLLKVYASKITKNINIYAIVSILETEKVDLEDYLKNNDVFYVNNLVEEDVDIIGTLNVKGVEYKIKTKKVSSSGSGLTNEQEKLLNDLVIESNVNYNAGTQRMVGMVYENNPETQTTKGKLVGLPIPSVSFQQKVTSGVEIGTLTVNGLQVKIYAPTGSGSGGGVTEERVQEMINNTLSGILTGDY